jgi:hypothetical protein
MRKMGRKGHVATKEGGYMRDGKEEKIKVDCTREERKDGYMREKEEVNMRATGTYFTFALTVLKGIQRGVTFERAGISGGACTVGVGWELSAGFPSTVSINLERLS